MVTVEIRLYLALPLALLGAAAIFRDAKRRGMETADVWAVGFFVAFFLLPLIGGDHRRRVLPAEPRR